MESVDVDQTLLGRIFNYGNVTIRGTGTSFEKLRMIDAPLKLRTTVTAGWDRLKPSQTSQGAKVTQEPALLRPAPRHADYSVVEGSRGPRRDFRITVGLREGWDAEGRVYDISEAVRTAHAWMRRRVAEKLPALSGMFTRAEVTYAWPRPDGSVGSDREPVAVFTGEAVHAYLGALPEEDIEVMLNELAVELGAALGQERIYVAFAARTWDPRCRRARRLNAALD